MCVPQLVFLVMRRYTVYEFTAAPQNQAVLPGVINATLDVVVVVVRRHGTSSGRPSLSFFPFMVA